MWSTRGYPGLVRKSDGWGKGGLVGNAFPAHVQTPTFSSHKVHGNYVDCVR